ncbi:MAG: alpha/beta hydrolase [Thiohalomonadales bacterium]
MNIKTSPKSLIVATLFSVAIFASSTAYAIQLNSDIEGGSGPFNALLLQAAGTPDVAVVLMHGRTSNPDGAVVRQARNALNSAGYTTISIVNPHAGSYLSGQREFPDYIADIDALNYAFPEAYARIRTAINYLSDLGVKKVVLLGFSMGSRFMSAHIANNKKNEPPIIGFIGVGMVATSIAPLNQALTLESVTVPVLDIYGDDDIKAANSVSTRRAAYGGDSTSYTVNRLDCASGLPVNDCHKLKGLKTLDGKGCRVFENSIITWVIANAPLATAQDKGVCVGFTGGVGDGGGNTGGGLNTGGGGIHFGLLVILVVRLFYKKS